MINRDQKIEKQVADLEVLATIIADNLSNEELQQFGKQRIIDLSSKVHDVVLRLQELANGEKGRVYATFNPDEQFKKEFNYFQLNEGQLEAYVGGSMSELEGLFEILIQNEDIKKNEYSPSFADILHIAIVFNELIDVLGPNTINHQYMPWHERPIKEKAIIFALTFGINYYSEHLPLIEDFYNESINAVNKFSLDKGVDQSGIFRPWDGLDFEMRISFIQMNNIVRAICACRKVGIWGGEVKSGSIPIHEIVTQQFHTRKGHLLNNSNYDINLKPILGVPVSGFYALEQLTKDPNLRAYFKPFVDKFVVFSPGCDNLKAEDFFNPALAKHAKGLVKQSMDVKPAFMLKDTNNTVSYWTPDMQSLLSYSWILGDTLQHDNFYGPLNP